MRLWSFACMMASVAFACTPSEIARDYARYNACDESKVEVGELGSTAFGSRKFRASGCNEHGALFYCRGTECASPEITITKRHAKQFGCEPRSISAEYLDGGAWKANGCGRELTYHCFEEPDFVLRCVAETSDEMRKIVPERAVR